MKKFKYTLICCFAGLLLGLVAGLLINRLLPPVLIGVGLGAAIGSSVDGSRSTEKPGVSNDLRFRSKK